MIRGQALLQRARPAKPPKPRRDLEVIQVGTVAAAGADELIYVVAAALDTAVHDAGRLSPQDRRGAVAGLPGERRHGDAVEPGTHPRVTAIMRAQSGDGRRPGNRSGTGHDVRGASTAHSAHRQAVVPPATGVWSSDLAYHQTLTCRPCAANAQPGPILPGHPERYAPAARAAGGKTAGPHRGGMGSRGRDGRRYSGPAGTDGARRT